MNNYVTGNVIRTLRERKHLTQEQLAEKLFVSSKAVSKWETGNGFPDISLLEPLAAALDISVIELLGGKDIYNANVAANMLKSQWYVCPVCGNVIHTSGEAVVCCCGITLPPLTPEEENETHFIQIDDVGEEYFVHMEHPMNKSHYISFFAAVSDNGVQLVKLYPEGPAQAYFCKSRLKTIYAYCNRHGLFQAKVRRGKSEKSF